ncbi:hypothetical protein ACIRTB_32460 [Streptomyces sp. NPDC101158]|uniref:hypothetical protein n=1 Tax=Streptomyces sp. NPDC101158 TaxID=3366117 RepID=UPI003816923F
MGLILCPGDGDDDSPDASWSCTRFHSFRRRLAASEGFDLGGMWGFGGDRSWVDESTVLKPLLNHPDVGGDDLSPADCMAMLPRLEAITDEWTAAARADGDPLLRQHIEDADLLAVVLRFCIDRDVPVIFV